MLIYKTFNWLNDEKQNKLYRDTELIYTDSCSFMCYFDNY